MSEYDAIVYDLDGTLVRLDVDWDAVRERCVAVLRARDVEVDDADIWETRTIAADHDALDRVDAVIAEFEREGAMSADRLPIAETLPRSVPVGVCSLNDESACRIALELHGIDHHVDVVVGRGTVETVKPDPAGLLYALEEMDVPPDRALFVGDSASDKEAARRAGMAFEWARDHVE